MMPALETKKKKSSASFHAKESKLTIHGAKRIIHQLDTDVAKQVRALQQSIIIIILIIDISMLEVIFVVLSCLFLHLVLGSTKRFTL
jgi:hypothetical protein